MYKEEQDSIGLFLQEYYEIVQPGGLNPPFVGATEMYEHYLDHTKRVGGKKHAQTAFGIQLRSKGLKNGRDTKGRSIWYGIKKRENR